jgi:hypothetical protein
MGSGAVWNTPRRVPGILPTVRRLFVACLLALLALLPAVDSVYCPDGCSDSGRTRYAWQTDVSAAADGCGLCLNGVAVSSPPQHVAPAQRIHPAPEPRMNGAVLSIPRPIDQPPRLS